MINNSIVRVTKAMKLAAIKDFISEDSLKIFPASETKAEYVFDAEEAKAFIDKLIEDLAKKNSSERGLSPDQKKNEEYKEKIVEYLRSNEAGASCTQIFKEVPELNAFSVQKVTALMTQLKDGGMVIAEKGKGGKTIFKLA